MQYRVKNRRLKVDLEDEGDFADFSQNVYVSKVRKDLISGEEFITVVIEYAVGEWAVTIPRNEIGKHIVCTLSKYGLSCVDNNTNNEVLQVVLNESADLLAKEYFHQSLGFVTTFDGAEVFLHHHPFGVSDPMRCKSIYKYEDFVKPHGSLMGWKNAVTKLIYGKGHMELALSIGAVAPVAHILKEGSVIDMVPLIALIGASTSGKTTSLIVASSLWYSQSMITDFNCTQNAMMTQLSQSCGVVMLVDESSAVPDWDLTSFIYNLPTGKAKLRSKSDGTLQKRQTFSGAIVFTGETSFFDQTRNTKGLHARLLELTLPWTESAEHAEAIAREFGRHYAVAAQPLMDWILKNKHLLKSMYQEYYEGFIELSKDFLTDTALKRLLKICALIATAADVLNQALGLNLDVDKIAITLIEVMQEKSEALRNNPLIWYQKLLNRVMNNKSKFPKRDEISKSSTLWGISDYHKSNNIVWIREDKFEEFISQITTVELKLVKQLLADGRYILRDDSRHYTFKKNVHGVEQMYYGVFTTHPPKNPDRIVPRRTKLLK